MKKFVMIPGAVRFLKVLMLVAAIYVILSLIEHYITITKCLNSRVQSFNERLYYYETQLGNCRCRIDELERTLKKMSEPIRIEDLITTKMPYNINWEPCHSYENEPYDDKEVSVYSSVLRSEEWYEKAAQFYKNLEGGK